MAKKGIYLKKGMEPFLKDTIQYTGWTLCVGAGTSAPIVPSWFDLVDNLIQSNCNDGEKIDFKTYKQIGFSADAMLQAVKNNLKLEDEEFIKLLSKEIYGKIKEKVTAKQWKSFCEIHDLYKYPSDWSDFSNMHKELFSKMSASQIADVVTDAMLKGYGPKAILTFNGEAILLALLQFYYNKKTKNKKHVFDRIVNSICYVKADRTPFIHCHGVIPIDDLKRQRSPIAKDKLVFSEDSYLRIANNAFSWQSANFINACLNSRIVFVGVSLTDPNMRRWLSWVNSNRLNELRQKQSTVLNTTKHIWINKRIGEKEDLWIEESVSHLGIRLFWVDDWNQIKDALSKSLGI